jgi:hypothetical protein
MKVVNLLKYYLLIILIFQIISHDYILKTKGEVLPELTFIDRSNTLICTNTSPNGPHGQKIKQIDILFKYTAIEKDILKVKFNEKGKLYPLEFNDHNITTLADMLARLMIIKHTEIIRDIGAEGNDYKYNIITDGDFNQKAMKTMLVRLSTSLNRKQYEHEKGKAETTNFIKHGLKAIGDRLKAMLADFPKPRHGKLRRQ